MKSKTINANSKLNNYMIPDNILKKDILDIKNKITSKLFSFKNNNNNMIINDRNIRSNRINQYENNNNKSFYDSCDKIIPSLLKKVIVNSHNTNIKKENQDNADNNSKKIIKSLGLIKLVKSRRPSSSVNNSNNNGRRNNQYKVFNNNDNGLYSMNEKIYQSLLYKNEHFEIHSIYNHDYNNIDKSIIRNRPESSKFKNRKFNILKKSEKEKDTDSSLLIKNKTNSSRYTIKLKSKYENKRYNEIVSNEDNTKQIIKPICNNKKNLVKRKNLLEKLKELNASKKKIKKFLSIDERKKKFEIIPNNSIYKEKKSKNLSYLLDNKKNESNLIQYRYVIYSKKKKNKKK
jgi:hypothetical protein